MKKMKLVQVEWLDAHSGSGWRSLDNIKANCRPYQCQSVGFLASRKNGYTALVAHLSPEDNTFPRNADGEIQIPNKCITKITELRPVRRRR